MAADTHLTAVEAARAQRRWWTLPLTAILIIALVIGMIVLMVGTVALIRYTGESTPHYRSDLAHFHYGSIGAERSSGIPVRVWKTLPVLFPDTFEPALSQGDGAYAAFGFLYEYDRRGRPADLPIGLSQRRVNGVNLVWFNCSVCHTGTWRAPGPGTPDIFTPTGERHRVSGMPSNNLDLHRFIGFLGEIAADERLAPDQLLPALEETTGPLGRLEQLIWRLVVLPRLREGLLMQAERLGPMMAGQPAWGPGRVDTFNPYKLIQLNQTWAELSPEERIGMADFPSIFLQGPREGMHLHWDGNNPSLRERNLSAAVGAGLDLTIATDADHRAIRRVAHWLKDLEPPPSPLPGLMPEPASSQLLEHGKSLYMAHCAACHGHQGDRGYVFEGDRLGQVEPIEVVGTDRARLDSYTESFRQAQRKYLGFQDFVKTQGYANHPLDGLWLRGPFLHNGSVPTLYHLLLPPEQRPTTFLRGSDIMDPERVGFVSPPCDPGEPDPPGFFCFDTRLPGNGNGGHDYATASLTAAQRAALLAYLRTF
ncbi:cytochrome c [Ectothiorhodospira lacustris]|uniref:c-type cytochrome n=1 Tax=Ectothiorhodospira lacustris TaxID=2899127 RepID=UPI001EE7B723|nr:cytochrome c [Ectothiorhodospira lacustris]MCG5508755.1 cytochrome c [Ectothiorhodospira lacustris]MCG5520546.1 cytochrome c [Ectothiorhodospira lacustris]